MKFFEELFTGQLHPIEDISINNSEYKAKAKCLSKCSEELEKALTEEQRQLLYAYKDAYADVSNILQAEAYRIGVAHGIKISEELEPLQ